MRIIRVLTVGILMALASNTASAETAAKIKNFNWRPVMDAITQVESKGNAKAKTVRTQEYCKFRTTLWQNVTIF